MACIREFPSLARTKLVPLVRRSREPIKRGLGPSDRKFDTGGWLAGAKEMRLLGGTVVIPSH